MFNLIPAEYRMAALLICALLIGAISFGTGFAVEKHFADAELNTVISNHNAALNEQKAQASNQLALATKKVADLQSLLADIIGQLNQQRALYEIQINKINADNVRRIAAAGGLRFKPDAGSTRCSSTNTSNQSSTATNASGTASIRLPDSITANLLDLTRDANKLAADYRICFDYTNKLRQTLNMQ
ncbi:hypothetical protein HQ393_04860 [Chitinibacter bivalviorum]|uniref:Lysis protein n=1 Tax=Chitinibacter bivalviorum TaxID=2739434 RepID=A0A7H9BHA3_9NEIS|nr:hypothetical protein [Chitinibacter bivalviorum]QLG87636.1 hypothetical protein HQ393_04860 [Chitinibacter bivalviorum]